MSLDLEVQPRGLYEGVVKACEKEEWEGDDNFPFGLGSGYKRGLGKIVTK